MLVIDSTQSEFDLYAPEYTELLDDPLGSDALHGQWSDPIVTRSRPEQ